MTYFSNANCKPFLMVMEVWALNTLTVTEVNFLVSSHPPQSASTEVRRK